MDIRLAFIGSDGTTVLSYGYNGAMGENNTLSMQNLSAGTYYLLLSQFGYGSYNLQTSFEETSTSIEVLEKYGFSTYPNPFYNQINIKSDLAIKQVAICNLQGAQLMYEEVKNNKQFSLTTTGLKKGIYLLSVEYSTGDIKTLRIIKQ